MATATPALETVERVQTVADLVKSLGDVPLERIRMHPLPGTATEDELIRINDGKIEMRCELIDHVLVEKAQMSYLEDSLTTVLVYYLHKYLRKSKLGKGFTAGAIYRMVGGNVRLPDFSVCLSDKFPTGRVERVPVADFAPDLAVEVLSLSNTRREIELKRKDFFESGTKLIWVVDPGKRIVEVYTSVDEYESLTEDDVLTGGEVLPGFELSIREWFREAEEV